MGTFHKLFGSKLKSAKDVSAFASMVSLAFHGIKTEKFTPETYFNGLAKYYGITFLDGSDLPDQIAAAQSRLMRIDKKDRKKIRAKIVEQLEFDPTLSEGAPRPGPMKFVEQKQAKPLKIKSPKGRLFPKSNSAKDAFYKSWEWRTLRMKALKLHGPRCQCCGATTSDVDISGRPVRIVVDHIKPISRFWDLRLELSNLQIACDECNMGKGAWDMTDWR